MSYSPHDYAAVLTDLSVRAKNDAERTRLAKRFWEIVNKHGDSKLAERIIVEAERRISKTTGHNLWEVETARDTKHSAPAILKGLLGGKDTFRMRINPALIAGVRITKNREEQLDGSLAHRLEQLFAHSTHA